MDMVSNTHRRRSIRLQSHDYTHPGAYFVTICTWQMQCLFGEVMNGEIQYSPIGLIVKAEWKKLPRQFPQIQLDEFIIMPNHLHGIIIIKDGVGATRIIQKDPFSSKPSSPNAPLFDKDGSPLQPQTNMPMRPKGPESGSLGAIIGQFKSQATKRIWKIPEYARIPIWQRNYYEHIIRDDTDWSTIIAYITSNPSRWIEDRFYP